MHRSTSGRTHQEQIVGNEALVPGREVRQNGVHCVLVRLSRLSKSGSENDSREELVVYVFECNWWFGEFEGSRCFFQQNSTSQAESRKGESQLSNRRSHLPIYWWGRSPKLFGSMVGAAPFSLVGRSFLDLPPSFPIGQSRSTARPPSARLSKQEQKELKTFLSLGFPNGWKVDCRKQEPHLSTSIEPQLGRLLS